MATRVLLAVTVGVWVAACSPFGGGAFTCESDGQCGAGGKCSNSFCSFADPSCMSGYRYGELSGGASNTCVAADIDAGIDAHVGMDGLYCYGTGLVTACFLQPPMGSVSLPATIDTGGSMCSTAVVGTAPWCVIAGDTITAATDTAVTGSQPLVVIATGTINVMGTIDVSSHMLPSTQIGANADAAGCALGTAPVTASAAGGAGGSFGGLGGNGGDGTASSHGIAGNAFTPTALRGGCPGQKGDNGATTGVGGNPGHGGGALYLIANTSITVQGVINASGAGAVGGTFPAAGAGGGGAGGMIGFDAPTVTVTGTVFANGGGGGEGSGLNTHGHQRHRSHHLRLSRQRRHLRDRRQRRHRRIRHTRQRRHRREHERRRRWRRWWWRGRRDPDPSRDLGPGRRHDLPTRNLMGTVST